MPTKVTCPTCDAPLTAPAGAYGQAVACPRCRAMMTLPTTDPAPPAARPVVAAASSAGDDDDSSTRPARRRFRCPFCGTDAIPVVKRKISLAGWATFIALLFVCLPLFWIGLLIKDEHRECRECGMKVGG